MGLGKSGEKKKPGMGVANYGGRNKEIRSKITEMGGASVANGFVELLCRADEWIV